MNMIKSLLLALLFAAAGSAANIQFTGTPTGVNDGRDYVMPYQITVDGSSQLVACYDFLDDVSNGQLWSASLLTLSQAAASGFFGAATTVAAYQRVAWLYAQTYSDPGQQIGLQYALWNVFSSVSDTVQSRVYEAAADAAAATGYSGFDFSSFRFIQQAGAVAGQPGTVQAFVYSVNPLGSAYVDNGAAIVVTSEPGAGTLLATGALLMLAGAKPFRLLFRRNASSGE